jgi:hypothetical protein
VPRLARGRCPARLRRGPGARTRRERPLLSPPSAPPPAANRVATWRRSGFLIAGRPPWDAPSLFRLDCTIHPNKAILGHRSLQQSSLLSLEMPRKYLEPPCFVSCCWQPPCLPAYLPATCLMNYPCRSVTAVGPVPIRAALLNTARQRCSSPHGRAGPVCKTPAGGVSRGGKSSMGQKARGQHFEIVGQLRLRPPLAPVLRAYPQVPLRRGGGGRASGAPRRWPVRPHAGAL